MKLRTLSPGFDVVDAPCEYASVCGGCKTQNLAYEAQLRYKEEQVRDLMIHVGKFPRNGVMRPIVGCDVQYHYRNKVSMYVGFSCDMSIYDLIEYRIREA